MSSSRLEKLFEFLNASPADPFLLFAIAKEYEKLDKKTEALEYYIRLTSEHADYVGTYYHLGKLYEQQGAVNLALQTYTQGMVVAKKAGDQHALGELAGAKLALEDE